ncbi:MAG: sensor N-terminal transmembrane domain-containing protein [Rhodospirillales bacterium]|nr:sensor N-terminal transmembrane domain-containing protein [Rhodospirillales bacterium]
MDRKSGSGDLGTPSPSRRRLSPISRRILAVNVFALAVLVVGLLYVGQYRQELIESEIAALTTQAEMFAAALGEAAVGPENSENQQLLPDIAGQIVRRLAVTTHTSARLVALDGRVLTDSGIRTGPGGRVQIEDLPPPNEAPGGFMRKALEMYDRVLGNFLNADFRPPASGGGQRASYPEIRQALAGENGSAVSRDAGGNIIVAVAVPVQRYKKVLGALNLVKDTRFIEEAVYQVRLDILKMFGIALLITVALSVYLAGTIARPLRRLALAADHVRRGLSRQYTIPDLGRRRDEIGELCGALKDMTEAMWQRMDAIEGFAADVAHEIKNPLTSLKSAVETARRLDDPDQQRKLMVIIQDDIDRLDRLISDISNASRIDAELSRAEMTPVDIRGVLHTLVQIHRASDTAGHISLGLNLPAEKPLVVDGIEDRIVQVLRNLISNAISFSPQSGRIQLSGGHGDGYVEITVEDEGPGLPAGVELSIFERFYRERPEGEKFGSHSGLGLSISKQIVAAHGGTIRAENRTDDEGKVLGARFIVRFPEAQ